MPNELLTAERHPSAATPLQWPPEALSPQSRIQFRAMCHLEGDGLTLSLWRCLLVEATAVVEACVWRGTMADAETAAACSDWLTRDTEKLRLLSALAPIATSRRIRSMLIAGARREIEEQAELAREAAEEADRIRKETAKAAAITAYFRGRKSFRLELQRGSDREPFWCATFGEGWERDRFWDWFKWQTDRWEDLRRELSDGATTPVDIERRLLREMLAAERSARAAGAAAGGRRPLRFWRGA